MTSGMRDLMIDELDVVSGGVIHTEVRKTTLIDVNGKGILAIGTVSIDGGGAGAAARRMDSDQVEQGFTITSVSTDGGIDLSVGVSTGDLQWHIATCVN